VKTGHSVDSIPALNDHYLAKDSIFARLDRACCLSVSLDVELARILLSRCTRHFAKSFFDWLADERDFKPAEDEGRDALGGDELDFLANAALSSSLPAAATEPSAF
jgi:hypothetical protein